jgi:hypothetical protein
MSALEYHSVKVYFVILLALFIKVSEERFKMHHGHFLHHPQASHQIGFVAT